MDININIKEELINEIDKNKFENQITDIFQEIEDVGNEIKINQILGNK